MLRVKQGALASVENLSAQGKVRYYNEYENGSIIVQALK
jgi:hypothetical protein